MANPTSHQQIVWSIARMRRCLEWFGKLDHADRLYVLARIAQKDAPLEFDQVRYMEQSRG